MMLLLTGCEVIALVTYIFAPSKIKARHKLADVPTLILVDDPSNRLGDPGLTGHIAHHAGFTLSQHGVLQEDHLVSTGELYALVARLGHDYARTAVDRIGSELGAQQVIHVYVDAVTFRTEPGLLRPTATVQVRVIDAVEGRRVYPLNPLPAGSTTSMGDYESLVVTMKYQGDNSHSVNVDRDIQTALAQRIGRDVARLFFDYLPRQPGEPFEQ